MRTPLKLIAFERSKRLGVIRANFKEWCYAECAPKLVVKLKTE